VTQARQAATPSRPTATQNVNTTKPELLH